MRLPCMLATNTVPYLLKQLRLPTIARYWESHTAIAESQHVSYANYLAGLLDLELAQRGQSRLTRAYHESKLPAGKTMATFDFTKVMSVNKAHIQSLSESTSWINDAQNLVLLGASGVGKTHLAAAIAYGLLEQGIKVFFTPTTHLVQTLQQAKSELKLKQSLDRLSRFDLLILDDMGYVKKTEQETSVLFELIAHRYESGSLIITANQSFSEWDELFPDKVMAVAALDRVVHHATIIKVEGESYRAHFAKEKNDLLRSGSSVV